MRTILMASWSYSERNFSWQLILLNNKIVNNREQKNMKNQKPAAVCDIQPTSVRIWWPGSLLHDRLGHSCFFSLPRLGVMFSCSMAGPGIWYSDNLVVIVRFLCAFVSKSNNKAALSKVIIVTWFVPDDAENGSLWYIRGTPIKFLTVN